MLTIFFHIWFQWLLFHASTQVQVYECLRFSFMFDFRGCFFMLALMFKFMSAYNFISYLISVVAFSCWHSSPFGPTVLQVNEHNTHQTQLLGCTDLSLSLYNKTIGAFPVDCFQIPGDPNQVHKERKFNMMPNWMPWCWVCAVVCVCVSVSVSVSVCVCVCVCANVSVCVCACTLHADRVIVSSWDW